MSVERHKASRGSARETSAAVTHMRTLVKSNGKQMVSAIAHEADEHASDFRKSMGRSSDELMAATTTGGRPLGGARSSLPSRLPAPLSFLLAAPFRSLLRGPSPHTHTRPQSRGQRPIAGGPRQHEYWEISYKELRHRGARARDTHAGTARTHAWGCDNTALHVLGRERIAVITRGGQGAGIARVVRREQRPVAHSQTLCQHQWRPRGQQQQRCEF